VYLLLQKSFLQIVVNSINHSNEQIGFFEEEISLKKFILISSLILGLLGIAWINPALAADDPVAAATAAAGAAQIAGDTGFMMVCAALVLLMTPGLAFFYGGFVRSRNVLNTMMMSFILMGIVGVTWVLWGYSLSFAPGNAIIGGFHWLFLNDVKPEAGYYIAKDSLAAIGNVGVLFVDGTAGSPTEGFGSYSPTVPHQLFMIYQAMFAIVTPALISGAIVERISFKAYFWFMILWAGILYPIFAHMVWGVGGLMGLNGGMGALDFAGGTVVHISSGVSALVAAWVIGPRHTHPEHAAPHNVPFILLGAGLLWFGWFGFNGGSALSASAGSFSLATVAFVATTTAASSAALMWVILEWVLRGQPTAVGIATGAVAGLVGITPAAGFVSPISAILIGAITATACFFAISLKAKLQFDDSLDTFPVHGVGGTTGAILTGIFASKAVNPGGADGLLYGNPGQIVTQIVAVAITYVLAGVGTFIILKLLDLTIGLRVKPEVEMQGMDISQHGEEAYGSEISM
jgi:ammonium transporter, Amt family